MSKYKVGFYTAKHILGDYVISNYFDMTEWRNDEKMVLWMSRYYENNWR